MTTTMVGHDYVDVKEDCSTSEESITSDASTAASMNGAEGTIEFDAQPVTKKQKRKHTKRELKAHIAEKHERDRLGLTMPDVVRDREKERKFVRIATKGVVQLFNAVAERQQKLNPMIRGKMSMPRKNALLNERFQKKLSGNGIIKEDTSQSNSDVKKESDDESADLLDVSEIKTEPESDGD